MTDKYAASRESLDNLNTFDSSYAASHAFAAALTGVIPQQPENVETTHTVRVWARCGYAEKPVDQDLLLPLLNALVVDDRVMSVSVAGVTIVARQ